MPGLGKGVGVEVGAGDGDGVGEGVEVSGGVIPVPACGLPMVDVVLLPRLFPDEGCMLAKRNTSVSKNVAIVKPHLNLCCCGFGPGCRELGQ